MPRKAIIVFGTRYGATTTTAEEISKVLCGEGFDVKVVNAKEEKVDDISEYDLVIVGSGMQMEKWTGETDKFLKKFQKELAAKKVALFVSSGAVALLEYEKKTDQLERMTKKYLEEKAAKYQLQPCASAIFGGVWDFNKIPWWARKALSSAKTKMEEAGMKETTPGLYDTRDWEEIRCWAKELAAK